MARRQTRVAQTLIGIGVAAFAVLSAAGGPDEASSPKVVSVAAISTPTPIPTEPPAPTATPVPTATPAPTATPTPTPFEIKPGLAARLPADWDPTVTADLSAARSAEAPVGGVLGPVVPNPTRWEYSAVLGKLGPRQRVLLEIAEPVPAREGVAPLTGLAGSPEGRAVVIKIDNVPAARPQIGLARADIIYEELVESGVTRFAAVFHSDLPDVVGPVRSGRSTDIGIIDSFNEPVFAFSGANSIFDRLIDDQPIVNRGAEVAGGYWREGSRPAPHNMYTNAAAMQAAAEAGGPPLPHLAFRGPDDPVSDAEAASTIRLRYLEESGAAIEFRYDETIGGWLRWQRGTPHVDAVGGQLAPTNVIVQIVDYLDTGLTDKWGEVLYEGVTVGSGPALVFTDGRVQEVIWTRARLQDPPTFTTPDGDHVPVLAGQTFISLIAPGGVTWE